MGKKLSRLEVADIIEDALADFGIYGDDCGEFARQAVANLVAEGVIDDREVDI